MIPHWLHLISLFSLVLGFLQKFGGPMSAESLIAATLSRHQPQPVEVRSKAPLHFPLSRLALQALEKSRRNRSRLCQQSCRMTI